MPYQPFLVNQKGFNDPLEYFAWNEGSEWLNHEHSEGPTTVLFLYFN